MITRMIRMIRVTVGELLSRSARSAPAQKSPETALGAPAGSALCAMCGGSSKVPFFTAAWPTAEFAGMAIEGNVKLAYRSEFQEMDTAEERIAVFTERVDKAYERAKAINSAEFYGIEDVIDPATSRDWIVAGLNGIPEPEPRTKKKRPYIDTW